MTVRNILITATLLLSLLTEAKSQEKKIDFNLGYPIQLTTHNRINEWNNITNLNCSYQLQFKYINIGTGINYSRSDYNWGTDIVRTSSLDELTPFIKVGKNIEVNKLSIIPELSLGYSFIHSNNDVFLQEDKNGLFVSPSIMAEYEIWESFSIGLKTSFNFINQRLYSDDSGLISPQVANLPNDFISYFSTGITISYRY